MKTYTISSVRTTLYPIMQNIFSTSFTSKYENNISKYESNMDAIMYLESSKADKAIIEMSLFLDSITALDSISKKLSSKTICTIYLRYYFLSSYLMRQPQDDTLELPSDKSDFFVILLNDFWKKSLEV